MTNFQIIFDSAVQNEIFTKEQALQMLEQNGCLPLHTFAGWKQLGFSVKKGEHAKMTTYIWKRKNKKAATKEDNDEETNERDFFKTKAFFFTAEQVERITA